MKTASWIVSLALTAFVLSFSAQTGSASGELSSSIVATVFAWIEQWLPSWEIDFDVLHTLVRKGAHVASYLILGVSWMITFRLSNGGLGWFGAVGLLLALLGEGIQWFVADRGPSLIDSMLFNFPGYVLGGLLVFLWHQRKNHRKNNVS